MVVDSSPFKQEVEKMFKEALLIVTMTAGGGNAEVGSESVTALPSIEACNAAIRVFRSTKGSQYRVVNRTNSVKFSENVNWLNGADRHYELTCVGLDMGDNNQ
jgi:hypothetical protein